MLDKAEYFYRIHDDSAMNLNTQKKDKRIQSVSNIAVYLIERCAPYNDECVNLIDKRVRTALADIASLPFSYRVKGIRMLKSKRLLHHKLNDKVRIGKISTYTYYRYMVIRKKLRKIFHS